MAPISHLSALRALSSELAIGKVPNESHPRHTAAKRRYQEQAPHPGSGCTSHCPVNRRPCDPEQLSEFASRVLARLMEL